MGKLCGLVNLDKPAGVTSRQAVDRVQQLVWPAKAGHAGTLDPLATGVLVVAVGAATRLIDYVQRMPKHYRATFLLGRRSPTDDIEGDPPIPGRQEIIEAAEKLTGTIEQVPPAYSALKVAGRRAYELARSGKSVQLSARKVTVYRLEVLNYDYPQLDLAIECSRGTYVRSLGRDLARRLGTAAVMSALRRTAVGGFRVEQAVPLDQLGRETLGRHLLPPIAAVAQLPRIRLSARQVDSVRRGQTIAQPAECVEAGEYAAVDPEGRLIGVLVPRGHGRLGPTCNLPAG